MILVEVALIVSIRRNTRREVIKPATIEATDAAYLRQMAIYAAVLRDIFPGRRVEAALIWTDGPKLMPIPEMLMTEALADLGRCC